MYSKYCLYSYQVTTYVFQDGGHGGSVVNASVVDVVLVVLVMVEFVSSNTISNVSTSRR